MYLTTHFSLAEMTASQAAARAGIKNDPSGTELRNLERTAATLEQIRALLGVPLVVTSGFRSKEVNRLVKGSKTSAHMKGLAADFIAPRFGTPIEICRKIVEAGLEFDQLIHEFGAWVHIGLSETSPRRELLTFCRVGRQVIKKSGIHPC